MSPRNKTVTLHSTVVLFPAAAQLSTMKHDAMVCPQYTGASVLPSERISLITVMCVYSFMCADNGAWWVRDRVSRCGSFDRRPSHCKYAMAFPVTRLGYTATGAGR